MRSLFLVLSLLLASVLVSAKQSEDLLQFLSRNTGKLTIQTLDTTKLQASYSRKTSRNVNAEIETVEGVHIESEVNNNVERVSIQNFNGKEIVSYHHIPNHKSKATLLKVMGQSFVITEDDSRHPRKTDYRVPEVFSEGVSRIFSQGEFDPSYLAFFDSHGANASRIAAIQEMLIGQEIPLMRDAVTAIGQRGIIGKENPPALPVMMMVMRLSALRDDQMVRSKKDATSQWVWDWFTRKTGLVSDPKDCTPKSGQIRCPSNGACCANQDCPSSEEDYCNGMCGAGCGCWTWACGDCCTYAGCLGHDECCRGKSGMFTTGCLIPAGFKCNEPYKC